MKFKILFFMPWFLLFTLLTFSPISGHAAVKKADPLLEVFKLYRKGAYPQALEKMKNLDRHKKLRKTVYFLRGVCNAKLQEYEEATKWFAKATEFKDQPADIHYEYGQALYAMDNLKEARKEFARSVKRKSNVPTSLYYIAYASQTLEEYPMAIKYYKIIDKKVTDVDIRQAANFQLAEVILKQTEKQPEPTKGVKEFVLPQFEKAKEVASNSAMAKDINKRIKEVEEKYHLGPPTMVNGKKLSRKKFKLKFTQQNKYDDNVTNEAEKAQVKATNKDSYIFKSDLKTSYRFDPNRVFTIRPEITLSNTIHTEDSNPSVYTNDQHTLFGNVKTEIYHYFDLKKQAKFTIEAEYGETYRDWDKDKSKEYYSRDFKVSFAEEINFLPWGPSTIKFKRKVTNNHDSTQNSTTDTFNLSQTLILPGGKILLPSVNIDVTDSKTNTNDTTAYLYRVDYIHPKIFEKVKLSVGLGFTATDTKKNKATRGTEKQYQPNIKFSRDFWEKFEATLSYTYTDKDSNDEVNYAYQKNDVYLEASYSY